METRIQSTTLERDPNVDPSAMELFERRNPIASRVEHTQFGQFGSVYGYNDYEENTDAFRYKDKLAKISGTPSFSTTVLNYGSGFGGPSFIASEMRGEKSYYLFGLESPDGDMKYALAIPSNQLNRTIGINFSDTIDILTTAPGAVIIDQEKKVVANAIDVPVARRLKPHVDFIRG